jgi:predicted permease
LVSGNFFDVLGVKPLLGRTFNREEANDVLGAHPVAVISAGLWRKHFHSDPRILGKPLHLNRHSFTIIGVTSPEFRGSSPVMHFDLWVPATMAVTLGLVPERSFTGRGERGSFSTICRLRAGVSVAQARAEAGSYAARLAAAYPDSNAGIGATVMHTWEEHNGINEYLSRPLAILLAVSFVVLLIVCANVANLLLARSVGRQREFGIRFALGAGRARVVFQVLTETLVLAIAGSGVGLLILLWMQGSLLAMVPSVGLPISASLVMNARILAFTALACVAAALISGASPALFVCHANLNEVLKDGSRSDTAGAASHRTRSLLVVGEVALATVALVGAGLFVRSFQNVRAINPGFDSSRVLLGRFFTESAGYSPAQLQQFASTLKDRLTTAPGVQNVTYTDFVPLSNTAGPYNDALVEGYTPQRGESIAVNRARVSPDYFSTMTIPLLEGRDFTRLDDAKAPPVIIVNQAFAKRFLNGANPVGRKVRVLGKWRVVVGMARDSKYFSPAEASAPHMYLPFEQFPGSQQQLFVLVRTARQPEETIPLFRRAVTETDRNASALHMVTLTEYTQVATFGQKVAATLMGGLGLMCLILAGSGLYSVMSYSVSQRAPEIGIRMAMGATPAHVIGMVVGQGMVIAAAGVVAGTAAAFAATRFISSMLCGVDASDPATFLMSAAFLAAVTLFATWLPAFRATRLDPISSLRR